MFNSLDKSDLQSSASVYHDKASKSDEQVERYDKTVDYFKMFIENEQRTNVVLHPEGGKTYIYEWDHPDKAGK